MLYIEIEIDKGGKMISIPKTIAADVLFQAIDTKNKEKTAEFVELFMGSLESIQIQDRKIEENRNKLLEHERDIREILETMKEGFKSVDKRFDDLIHQMDKRFDDLIHQMDKRFEQVDKRFDDINKRFNQLTWLIGIVFITLNFTIVFLKFFSN